MLDNNLASFKSLDDVYLKATYDIETNGFSFKEGEVIASFDKIQISGLNEFKSYVAARGGFDNRAHVFWENTKELKLTFSQGVFSKTQFGLLNNAKVLNVAQDEPVLISHVEELEIDEEGRIFTEYEPIDQIFIYEKATGRKIRWWKFSSDYLITEEQFVDIIITYRYNYTNGATVLKFGQQFLNGFLSLEGKTRVKDDTSGLITTGIIRIPKLKLMSGLSIKLGTQANPVVGNFQAVGVPVEERYNSYVAEFLFLNNDIDSDM